MSEAAERDRLTDVAIESRTNSTQIFNLTERIDSHFNDQRQQNNKLFDILNTLPTAKDLEILQFKVMEQVNKVGALQRKDIEQSRADCKAETEALSAGHKAIEKRLDKVKYTIVGGLAVASIVVSIIIWAVEVLAK